MVVKFNKMFELIVNQLLLFFLLFITFCRCPAAAWVSWSSNVELGVGIRLEVVAVCGVRVRRRRTQPQSRPPRHLTPPPRRCRRGRLVPVLEHLVVIGTPLQPSPPAPAKTKPLLRHQPHLVDPPNLVASVGVAAVVAHGKWTPFFINQYNHYVLFFC